MINRHEIRRLAVQVLFSGTDQAFDPAAGVFNTVAETAGLDSATLPAYLYTLVKGVHDHHETIDAAITQRLRPGWQLGRLNRADLAVLRLGVYELQYEPDLPVNVVLNEMIELAKEFGGAETPAFVNGVLADVAKERQ